MDQRFPSGHGTTFYSRLREPSFINHPEHIETVEQLIHLLGRRFELALEITVARLALGAESR